MRNARAKHTRALEQLALYFDTARIVVCRAVDVGADRLDDHLVRRIRLQQRLQTSGLFKFRIEPQIVALWRENYRHPIVNRPA